LSCPHSRFGIKFEGKGSAGSGITKKKDAENYLQLPRTSKPSIFKVESKSDDERTLNK
jgi:hypothetical protein